MNRRQFMCSSGAAMFAAGTMVSSVFSAQRDVRDKRPNILFINVDDLGWPDLGFMGSSFYETPRIDKLAEEGMVFTDAYAPAANCAPSRACLYTGQYGPRHGVYTVGSSERGQARFRKLIPTPNTEYIDPDNLTFASVIKDTGYATIHLGKWHVSTDPTRHGFETNVGGYQAGHPHGGYFSPYNNPQLSDGPQGEYLTHRKVDEAIKYLRNHDPHRPFLMSMQFYTVHTPLQAEQEVIEKYESKLPTPNHFNPIYAAMIEHLDTNVGRLLDTIDELGLRNNTLVLFTSDQGGLHNVSHQCPLRGEKGTYYEGGIRVPMVVRWPGKVLPRSRCKAVVSHIDFYPTFLEAAQVAVPADKKLDGLSLIPLWTEQGTLPERSLFWHFPVYLQAYRQGNIETRDPLFRTRPGSVIRHGRYKLHEYFEDGSLELYDLEKDIGERRNLIEILPEKARELHDKLKAWRKETGAPVPTEPNPQYDQEAEAAEVHRFYER